MKNSKIEWTHHTFNPWWGCVKVSPACEHCYAESFSKRTGHDVWGPNKPRRFFGASHWQQPLDWNMWCAHNGTRSRVFCASMADVFEDYQGPDNHKLVEARLKLWCLILDTPNLDWLLLTKRPENILRFIPPKWHKEFPSNIWIGTTVENQETADKRIPELLKVPARIRFLSMEPLLGEVYLDEWLWKLPDPICSNCPKDVDCDCGFQTAKQNGHPSIDLVICGGESGNKSRPMHPQWAQSLRDQCQGAGVPFFFKQWGDWLPHGQGFVDGYHEARELSPVKVYRIGKAKAGRLLDGKEWSELP
jgi:protein gp37